MIDISLNDLASNDDESIKPILGKRSTRLLMIDLAIWMALTAYAIALMILGKGKQGYVIAIIVYVFISLRLLARHVSVSQLIYDPIGKVVDQTYGRVLAMIPVQYRIPGLFAGTLTAILLTALLSPIDPTYSSIMGRLQSFLGIIFIIGMMTVTSAVSCMFSKLTNNQDRRAIPWHTVAVGLFLQFGIALFVLRTKIGIQIFQFLSKLITDFLETSAVGLEFLIGPYPKNSFAVNVLPAIIFFCAFISVVYYFGGMQYIVVKMAWLMMRLMDTSGSESVVAAASPFVGQGESALLVKPFVEFMTKSELHSTMTSGFATIAGIFSLAINKSRIRSFGVYWLLG